MHRPEPLTEEQYLARLEAGDGPIHTETAQRVLERRYLQRDAQGALRETAEGLWQRVARHVARAEPADRRDQAEALFAGLMRRGHFLPNSPTLMNAGLPGGQLAACFVLPVGDSIPQIFDAVKHMALVQKTGGGTGFSFSALRPAGDLVSTTKGVSSGPVTFMEVFDTATDTIKQGGRRRGANMGVLEVTHPDVLRFITEKADPTRLTNFNLSVGLTAGFMDALASGDRFALINPRSGETGGSLDAGRVLALLARCAWLSGEPGVLFLDRINDANPTPQLGRLESTNPCGELPLLPFESCNLGSLNLSRFVERGAVDWAALATATRWAVRFLDDVIETTEFPLTQVAEATQMSRKIGLGVMGFADLLIRLQIPYESDEALALADEVMGFVAAGARQASEALAAERGPFPAWAGSRLAAAGDRPRRNATVTTIAPTGTLSILGGCSAGIEPLFAPAYQRRFLDGESIDEVHPLFGAHLEAAGLLTDELVRRVAQAGHARVDGVPEDLAQLFVTAHEVSPSHHVAVQAAFQKHVDNSVSKTVNLPPDATEQDVADIIGLAYASGCKGITVYRDGSRANQVLSAATSSAPDRDPPPPCPEACPSCGAVPRLQGRICYCPACAWCPPLDSGSRVR